MSTLLAAALAAVAMGADAHRAPTGTAVVAFSVFSGLPPFQGDDRCEGLYAVRSDGGGLTRLSAPDPERPEGHYWPSFDPAGRTLAFGFFARRSARDLAVRLFALDLRSGRARGLERSDFPGAATWSPKGDAILVYRLRGRALHLARLDVRTGRTRQLAGRGLQVAMLLPSWSPDGTRIAYTARGAGPDTIWVMRADGSRKRRLGPPGASGATWSPDGGRIAFFRSVRGATELWSTRPDGRGARRLARRVLDRGLHSLAWSPSGRSVLFLREPPPRPFYPGSEHEVGDLYRLEVATGRARLLTRKVIPLGWAVNGALLLLRPRTASGELVYAVVVRTGTRERVVGVTDEEDVNIGSYPAWQPRRVPVRAAVPPFEPRAASGLCLDRLRALRTEIAR